MSTPTGPAAAREPTSNAATIAVLLIVLAALAAIGYFAFGGRGPEAAGANPDLKIVTPARAPQQSTVAAPVTERNEAAAARP